MILTCQNRSEFTSTAFASSRRRRKESIMTFYYYNIECFVEVVHILNCLGINFKVSWRYIEQGRVEFIVDVEVNTDEL